MSSPTVAGGLPDSAAAFTTSPIIDAGLRKRGSFTSTVTAQDWPRAIIERSAKEYSRPFS